MQLRIAHIQDECMSKEAEVDELRRRITQRLEEQQMQKKRDANAHQEEMDNSKAKNTEIATDLKNKLTKLEELKNDDE